MTITHAPITERPEIDMPRRFARVHVVGIVLTVLGVLLAASGGILLVLRDGRDSLPLARAQLNTRTSAFVADAGNIRDNLDLFPPYRSQPNLVVRIDNHRRGEVFVGVGSIREVNRYLAHSSFDRIASIKPDDLYANSLRGGSDGRIQVESAGLGSATPTPPDAQSFWIAKATGTSVSLRWRMDRGTELVIMDRKPAAVVVGARFDLSLPYLFAFSLALTVLGAVGALTGILILAVSGRMGRSLHSTPLR